MAHMLKTECSVLHTGNNIVHNTQSLAKALDLHESRLLKLVRKLTKLNVLAYAICTPLGTLTKVYMLNPFYVENEKHLVVN